MTAKRPLFPSKDDAGRPVLLVLLAFGSLAGFIFLTSAPPIIRALAVAAATIFGLRLLVRWAFRQDSWERKFAASVRAEIRDGIAKIAEFLGAGSGEDQ